MSFCARFFFFKSLYLLLMRLFIVIWHNAHAEPGSVCTEAQESWFPATTRTTQQSQWWHFKGQSLPPGLTDLVLLHY